MSATPLDLPVIISQLHYVQKFAHAEQAKPEIQKQLFAPVIAEHLRKQGKEQVAAVDKKEKTDSVDRDGAQQNQQHMAGERRKKEKQEDEEMLTSNASPWTGNIVNVKI